MKAKVKGELYSVKFHYDEIEGRPNAKDTVCVIEQLVQDHEGRICGGEIVASDVAQLSKHDVFDKPLGRKIAFTRACSQFEDRELRSGLWSFFLKTHKLPGQRNGCLVGRSLEVQA